MDWTFEPLTEVEEDYADSVTFRASMSRFPTGVLIITCRGELGEVHGMAANSFTSVSLSPPSVLISVKPGRMHGLLVSEGYFGASILTEAQQDYSSHFSGKRQPDFGADFVVRHRVPTLKRCLAWFECEIAQRVEVHDHTLFVARVMACESLEGSPLIFFGSRYASLGEGKTV